MSLASGLFVNEVSMVNTRNQEDRIDCNSVRITSFFYHTLRRSINRKAKGYLCDVGILPRRKPFSRYWGNPPEKEWCSRVEFSWHTD